MSPQSELNLTGARSGVFLFSGMAYEGLILGGMLWSFVGLSLRALADIRLDLLQWSALTLLVGLLLQFAIFTLKRKRFHNPVRNADLLALFEEVRHDLGKGEGIELWFRDIDRGVFLSTVNPLFKAMLFSDSSIADILENREKGKILLAREVLMMGRVSPLSGLALGLLVFLFFSFTESMTFFDTMMFFTIEQMPLILLLIMVGMLLTFILIPTIMLRSTRSVDQSLKDIYGSSAELASLEVLTGFKIPNEVIERMERDEAEEGLSPQRRALRNAAIAGIIAMPIAFILVFTSFPVSSFQVIFAALMSVLVGFGAVVITYMTTFMYFVFRPGGKRSTEWDIQHPFAEEIRRFLSKHPGYETVAVRAIKPPSEEMFGLVVERLKPDYTEETTFDMMPQILKDVQEVDLAGPFILSELRRKDIEKRYKRTSYVVGGIALVFLAIGMIWSLWSLTIHGIEDFLTMFMQIMVIYLLLAIPPLVYMSFWMRRAEIRSDVKIVRECPRFTEALQMLIDKHHTLPYGKTSYKTRLERIRSHLSQ